MSKSNSTNFKDIDLENLIPSLRYVCEWLSILAVDKNVWKDLPDSVKELIGSLNDLFLKEEKSAKKLNSMITVQKASFDYSKAWELLGEGKLNEAAFDNECEKIAGKLELHFKFQSSPKSQKFLKKKTTENFEGPLKLGKTVIGEFLTLNNVQGFAERTQFDQAKKIDGTLAAEIPSANTRVFNDPDLRRSAFLQVFAQLEPIASENNELPSAVDVALREIQTSTAAQFERLND